MNDEYVDRGTKAELEFVAAMKTKYPSMVINKSTDSEDIFEHWDYSFNGEKIDVKARRNGILLNSENDKCNDKFGVVELINRNDDKGSLYGNEDSFAFEIKTPLFEAFLIIPRLALAKYIDDNVQDVIVNNLNDAVLKKYMNPNEKFVLSVFSYEEIQKYCNVRLIRKP